MDSHIKFRMPGTVFDNKNTNYKGEQEQIKSKDSYNYQQDPIPKNLKLDKRFDSLNKKYIEEEELLNCFNNYSKQIFNDGFNISKELIVC